MKKIIISSGKLLPIHFKKRFISSFKSLIVLGIMLVVFQKGNAQVEPSSALFQTIKKLDVILFEKGFNQCLLSEIAPYISEDLEFYHDKGGISNTREEFMSDMKNNICTNTGKKVIRKLIENTMEVYPLYNEGVLYGAIQNGSHEFYIKEPNKELYITGVAKFSQVWLKENGKWILKRVLSYDHKAPPVKERAVLAIADAILADYAGQYEAPNTGKVSISKKGGGLAIKAGEMLLDVLPETKTLFFNKQAPLTFEFVKNTKGSVTKMIIRENGNIVEEAIRIQ